MDPRLRGDDDTTPPRRPRAGGDPPAAPGGRPPPHTRADPARRGASDRVSRTDLRSPVDGIVNEIAINTVGGFVQPGERLLDIVPMEDTLLVEARLKPSDVAFVLPGQKAEIKFTAYDFSIFGGLQGEVQSVGADSIIDPNTRENYYVVLIKTP